MRAQKSAAGIPPPRWDGSRVLFEVVCDDQLVPCAISLAALQEVSGRRHYKSADLLACFANARDRIAAAAVAKRRLRGPDHVGRLNLWADDLEQPEAEPPGVTADNPRAAAS